MAIRIQTVTSNTIDTHPNPQAVYGWIRDNWHDLAQHSVDEAISSLQALSKNLAIDVDYAISAVPDRGEYIRWSVASDDVFKDQNIPDLSGNCPLTGCYFDEVLLDAFRDAQPINSMVYVLERAGVKLLEAVHAETAHTYSDEGLYELCTANEYYFLASGQQA